jgi:hypothetical protein
MNHSRTTPLQKCVRGLPSSGWTPPPSEVTPDRAAGHGQHPECPFQTRPLHQPGLGLSAPWTVPGPDFESCGVSARGWRCGVLGKACVQTKFSQVILVHGWTSQVPGFGKCPSFPGQPFGKLMSLNFGFHLLFPRC